MKLELDWRRLVRFGGLGFVAVAGSLIYGASLGATLPRQSVVRLAILLTASTGFSWLVLGALLIWATHKLVLDLAEACLVTMAVGEAVLVPAALVNWGFAPNPYPFNIGVLILSNILMAAVFATQLGRLGVSRMTSLCLWVLGLNGTWLLFLALFGRAIMGGKQ